MIKRIVLGVLASLVLAHAQAAGDATAQVKKTLSEIMPGVTVDSVTKMSGMDIYEVTLGAQVLYLSADGRYLIQGDLFDLQNRKNLTETKREAGRAKVVAGVDEKSMIVFGPKKAKHTITVFTDIDCGYCRKLHQEIKEINDLDIRVRYMFFPRSGENTPSYFKAVSVWCAKDRHAAMTKAKAGENVENASCDNPVKAHMAAADQVGVRGTPTIVLPNGKVLPGYVPAAKLKEYLDQEI